MPHVYAPTTCPLFVEVSPLLGRRLTGIGRFAARLVEALARHTDLRLVSCVPREVAVGGGLHRDLLCGEEMAVSRGELPSSDADLDGWVRRLFRRPLRPHDQHLAKQAPGLYTVLRPPERHFARELGIFYDFTPLLLPWTHAGDTQVNFGIFFTQTARLYDKVIAISESTKSDASWLTPLPDGNVVVGYPGPSLCVDRHAHAGPVERRPNVILVVSTLEPRKNGGFLLDWFLETDVLPSDMELWWVGPEGWWAPKGWVAQLLERAKKPGGRAARIKFLGMVPDCELCRLYQEATFTVYPSLYEGFGFPVLDALRHGAPVLTGCHSSLQEFAGPGVFFFDPWEATTLDEACHELLDALAAGQRTLPFRRDDLDERFSWDALARNVLLWCA